MPAVCRPGPMPPPPPPSLSKNNTKCTLRQHIGPCAGAPRSRCFVFVGRDSGGALILFGACGPTTPFQKQMQSDSGRTYQTYRFPARRNFALVIDKDGGGPTWFPTCAAACICARGPFCARRARGAPGAGGTRGALGACGARGASGAQGVPGTLGPLGRQRHLVRAERVARVPHLASVAHLSSVLVPSGCPSNGDPWLCQDSGATYAVGWRLGVTETACGRGG